jgi:hypothetical protein
MANLFPPEGAGFVCDLKCNEEHLRLFSAMNSSNGGWTASLFDVNAKTWLSKDQWANDAEDGKHKAEEVAKLRLKIADFRFNWEKTPGL